MIPRGPALRGCRLADNDKLELVVEVDVNKANASIKSINTGLSSMKQAAGTAGARRVLRDRRLTVSMAKGFGRRQPPRGVDQKTPDWAKEWILGAAQQTGRAGVSLDSRRNADTVDRGESWSPRLDAVATYGDTNWYTAAVPSAIDTIRVLRAAQPPRRAPSSPPMLLEWPTIQHPAPPDLLLAVRAARPSRSGPTCRPSQAGCC